MTEFAFSGLGVNPLYGTPRNRWRRNEGAIPGGSSSGAAVSVADDMAHAGIGTDTGGSCRIPAAFNGLVGWKPTADRIPRDGAIPLSTTLDSVGPIGRSVSCCAALDAIMAGAPDGASTAADVPKLRFFVPRNFVLEGIETSVAEAFERALRRIGGAGVRVDEGVLPELDELPSINGKGGFAAYEAYRWHRHLIATSSHLYDPRVLVRIRRGAEQTAADYDTLVTSRADWIRRVSERLDGYDALLMPTTPIAPPLLRHLDDDAEYGRINLLALRNPSIVNFMDGCAMSLPMHHLGEPPAGFMIAGLRGRDQFVFAVAQAVERLLTP